MSNIGIIAPSSVPPAVVQKISADVRAVVRTPAMTERMAQLGTEALGTSPEDYTRLISSEMDKWGQVIKDAGVKPE
jgi:tripartite-type tricarboxylate transporter receptor subunit TctC